MTIFLLLLSTFFPLSFSYENLENHEHFAPDNLPQNNCGSNYLLPNKKARLGSHSFIIIGRQKEHLLLDHRSGTPPHNYQYTLRVKVQPEEMAVYEKLLKRSSNFPPAITTIDFDLQKNQRGRTYFCLQDLPKIFGNEKKQNDKFQALFPIVATWQLNANYEGSFKIGKSAVPSEPRLIINRKDVELLNYRYLPAYLNQKQFRRYIQKQGANITSRLSHNPKYFDEPQSLAQNHPSPFPDINLNNKFQCPADYFLKTQKLPKTRHFFYIFASENKRSFLFTSYYNVSPHNFHTALLVTLPPPQATTLNQALSKNSSPLLFQTDEIFCMADLKNLAKEKKLKFSGTAHGISLQPNHFKVLFNRVLNSFIDPQRIARDIFGFVDIKSVIPNLIVEARYNTPWNFIGKPLKGYRSNTCLLTKKAALQLKKVQAEVSKQGFSLLVFDCYRPQRTVDSFIQWAKNLNDKKMKTIFYPNISKSKLIPRYIDNKSGHSRGSAIDITLVKKHKKFQEPLMLKEHREDCRKSTVDKDSQYIDMGTSFDCFSPLSHTSNKTISKEAQENRQILKRAMTQFGFTNYPNEWWHYSLKDEPQKSQYFDFEVY